MIEFSKIILSSENPRLDISFCEEESISNMIIDQKEKLVELASDIVLHGLNPLELIAVFPSEVYPGYYEVAEGNRRVCVLKLLSNPSIIGPEFAGIASKIKQLSANFVPPTHIEVVFFNEEPDVRHWMEIRHMGEQSGKGLSKWNTVQKMRFQKKQTGSDALLDFWNWMDENKILSFPQILEVTKTNWQRVLRETYYPFLKLHYNGRYSVLPQDMPIFAERIREVQRRLAGQTVGIVYDQQRIEHFYNQLSEEKDINKTMSLFLSRKRNETVPDQWQTQVFLRVLMHAQVIYISSQPDEIIEKMHLIPAKTISEALLKAKEILGKEDITINAIPDGVSVIVK